MKAHPLEGTSTRTHIMKPADLEATLDAVLPGFAAYVADPAENDFSRDSLHGVMAACSMFVRERAISAEAWAKLADFANAAVAGDDQDLAEAVCTCFLENLAEAAHPMAEHLRGEARAYWSRWVPAGR